MEAFEVADAVGHMMSRLISLLVYLVDRLPQRWIAAIDDRLDADWNRDKELWWYENRRLKSLKHILSVSRQECSSCHPDFARRETHCADETPLSSAT